MEEEENKGENYQKVQNYYKAHKNKILDKFKLNINEETNKDKKVHYNFNVNNDRNKNLNSEILFKDVDDRKNSKNIVDDSVFNNESKIKINDSFISKNNNNYE